MNRLTSAAASSGTSYTYAYDADGNLTSASTTSPSSTKYYGYDNADELCWSGSTSGSNGTTSCPTTPTGDTSYTYDGDGNQTASGSTTVGYNSKNQTSAYGTETFAYAGLGQNIRTAAGSTSFSPGILGLANQSSGSSNDYFTRTPNGQLVSMRVGAGGTSSNYYYFTDAQNSVIRLTDSTGNSDVATYTYDPYGNTISATGTMSTTNPYRYGSGLYDASSGLTLLGERYYSSATGRFTQLDPSGQEANLYAYAADDPATNSDPTGCVDCKQEGGEVSAEFDSENKFEGEEVTFDFGTGGSAFAFTSGAYVVGVKDGKSGSYFQHHSGALFDASHHHITFGGDGFSTIYSVYGAVGFARAGSSNCYIYIHWKGYAHGSNT